MRIQLMAGFKFREILMKLNLIKKQIVFLFSVITLSTTQLCYAQASAFKFKHITKDEGLYQNNVRDFIKDRRGYMWILAVVPNRYDGNTLIQYNEILNDSTTFLGVISDVCEDRSGTLWFLSNKALMRYNPHQDNFTRFLTYQDQHNESVELSQFTRLIADTDSTLLIQGNGKVLRVYPASGKIVLEQLPVPPGINKSYTVSSIYLDGEGILWYALNDSPYLVKYDRIKNENLYYNLADLSGIKNATFSKMVDNFNGDQLILYGSFNQQQIFFFNKLTHKITYIDAYKTTENKKVEKTIMEILPLSDEEILVGYSENLGLGIINLKKKTYRYFVNDINNPYSLANNNIWSLYRSEDNIIWIGTQFGGADLLDFNIKPFRLYRKQGFNLEQSLSNNLVTSFHESRDGTIWVGTDKGGLNKFNPETEEFTHYMNNPDDPYSLSANEILSIDESSDGTLWLGTWSGGLNHFNPRTGKATAYRTVNSGILCDHAWQVVVSKDDKVLVGYRYCDDVDAAFSMFDPKTKKFTHFRHNPFDANSPPINAVSYMYFDPDSLLWISAEIENINYVYTYDLEKNKFTLFEFPDSTLFHYYTINSILWDRDDKYWLGTSGGGLLLFDRSDRSFTRYTAEKNGLPTDQIISIEKDKNGIVWMGSGKGLIRFDPKAGEVENYRANAGIQSDDFNKACASMYSSNGEMYFGGIMGFNVFRPEEIKSNQRIPPVYITRFNLFNKEISFKDENSPLTQHISTTRNINLAYNQNIFSFEFTALNYTNPELNQYAYYLDGFEEEWNYVGSNRTATYTNMNPGEYTFRVKASNNDGIWNETGTSIHITITPPFWITWWFRAIIILIIVAGIYLWYRKRMSRIKKQNRLLEQKVEERTSALNQKTVALEAAKQETDDILLNVKEGLFLMNKEYKLGSQYAQIMQTIFERKDIANQNFFHLLKGQVEEAVFRTTKRYFNLMFKEEMDEDMLDALNPLGEVKVLFNGGKRYKYLSFEFSRIKSREAGTIELMATVRDITEQILLEEKLKESEERTKKEMNWMLSILHVEPNMLQDFIEGVQRELDRVDSLLDFNHRGNDYKELLKKVFSSMHLIKGNASLLALEFFADQAHQFEDQIAEIQKKPKINTDDIRLLNDKLIAMRNSLGEVHNLLDRIGKIHQQMRPKRSYEGKLLLQSLNNLVNQLCKESGKKVVLKQDTFNVNQVPHQYWLMLKDILVQLVKNSVSHGIEEIEERKQSGKPEAGVIQLVSARKKDKFELVFSDDGRGLQLEKLKEKALASERWDAVEIDDWDADKLTSLIFESGISTADDVDMISGRGVGMDGVRDRIESHKGKILIDSKSGSYTRFHITLPLPTEN